jgi:hypothetical protein
VWSGHSCPLPLTLILILILPLTLILKLTGKGTTSVAPPKAKQIRQGLQPPERPPA